MIDIDKIKIGEGLTQKRRTLGRSLKHFFSKVDLNKSYRYWVAQFSILIPKKYMSPMFGLSWEWSRCRCWEGKRKSCKFLSSRRNVVYLCEIQRLKLFPNGS